MDKDRLTRRLSEVQRSRKILESRVQEETVALIAANEALQAEIAAHRRAEEELRLLLEIAQAVTTAKDFPTALSATVEQICHAMHLDCGEVWIPNSERTAIKLSSSYHGAGEQLEQFQVLSQVYSFQPGEGLPGRVWALRRPEWHEDVSSLPKAEFPRAAIASAAGLKAALGVPVVTEGEVLGVLLLFAAAPRTIEARTVEIASAVAGQLGFLFHHKQTEDELHRSETVLRAIVDNSTRVIYVKDKVGRYITINRQYEDQHHVTRDEIRGKTDYDIFPKEMADAFRKHDQEVAEKGIPMEFDEIAPLDDGPHHFISNKYPMFDSSGALYAVCGISTDITERKRREQELQRARDSLSDEVQKQTAELRAANKVLQQEVDARKETEKVLRRREEWLGSLISTTQDAVISINRGGRIVLFNPTAERLFGYKREEVTGAQITMLMPEPYASAHDQYVARYERTGEARAMGRIRTMTAKRKSGDQFPIELSVTEIASDEDVHYAAFIRDISEKTKLQEQLVEKERLAAIGATAAKIGHELSNPLNSISLAVQLLEQRLKKLTDIEETQFVPTVTKIKDEISRLNTLLLDFRAFARRETYRFRRANISELIDDCIELERLRLAESKTELEKEVPRELPEIAVDRDKIKQVLLNLCKNAVEAMPGGGKIVVKASASDDKIILEVTDTGIGIPPGTDIFEPFFTTKREGTGLGLTIVRQMIAAHGGTISYHSQPGKGTTFRIALPQNVNAAEG